MPFKIGFGVTVSQAHSVLDCKIYVWQSCFPPLVNISVSVWRFQQSTALDDHHYRGQV